MKKIKRFIPLLICVTVLLSACGKEKAEEAAAQTQNQEEPAAGETAVMKLVPEPIENEMPAAEETNGGDEPDGTAVQDGPADTADTGTTASGEASAPAEYETSDGFMGSFLLASDRDMIDTTNEYGVLYRVVYQASIEGDGLIACGSMDYRNFKDQDPLTISSDLTHIFKIDENTVFQKQGEAELETISKEEFAGYLDSRKDSGMYFEVEISGGVVKTALISS
ncbi:MAG: hypothetical protein K6F35_08815 [Lachnospiraceae bacterium]|nr:hypothetical protein [Lachnospiraceae bacterium]